MIENKHTTFQLSQDRQVLEAKLLAAFRDRLTDTHYTLPYSELNALVRGDVQKNNALSTKLTAAMKAVARSLNITLGRDPVRGGVVLIPTDQYTSYIDRRVGSIRRGAKRVASEAMRIATHKGLSADARDQVMARGALAGAIAAFGGKKAVARIEAEAKQSDGQPLSLNQTIDAFREKKA